MSDKLRDSVNQALAQLNARDSRRFEYAIFSPEEREKHFESSESSTSSLKDAFDLVLLLEAAQLVWHLKSLFCYRGLLQDDKMKSLSTEPLTSRQEVFLTIAKGTYFPE